MTLSRRSVHSALLATACLLPTRALAKQPQFSPWDVATVFFINKSDDRNRVDYAIRLTADCAPYGKEPVFPYWREFEHSPPVVTHTLGVFEYFAYGISDQRLIRQGGGTWDWQIRLKRLDRPITISTSKDAGGRCVAVARTTILGSPSARFLSVYAKLKGALSVAYLDVSGLRASDNQPITERVTP